MASTFPVARPSLPLPSAATWPPTRPPIQRNPKNPIDNRPEIVKCQNPTPHERRGRTKGKRGRTRGGTTGSPESFFSSLSSARFSFRERVQETAASRRTAIAFRPASTFDVSLASSPFLSRGEDLWKAEVRPREWERTTKERREEEGERKREPADQDFFFFVLRPFQRARSRRNGRGPYFVTR